MVKNHLVDKFFIEKEVSTSLTNEHHLVKTDAAIFDQAFYKTNR